MDTPPETILFRVAEASLEAPDDTVRGVVFPAVAGGEQTLRELVHEFKTNGPVYRRTVQTTLRASYTDHYRRGLIRLLDVLEFRSSQAHQPVIEALALVRRYAGAGNITYYPRGEHVPMHRGLRGDWEGALYREDARGRRRVVRMVYEVATLQREIDEGLNVIESYNAANAILAYGDGGDIQTNRRDDQELFVLCLRILQAALVYINTLMLQDILTEPAWTQTLPPADRRGLTPMFWLHLRPYGEINLDMTTRLNLGQPRSVAGPPLQQGPGRVADRRQAR